MRLLRDDSDDDVAEPQPIDACAQLSLRLGELGHIDVRGVVHEPDPDEARFGQRGRSPWSGEHEGWNIHAGVTVKQGDAQGRERLCRYVLRHPLSLQRLSWTKDGRLAYEVKYPRSPKQKHLLLDPVQLMARLASLIPPPRPLVRYFGVLSSASSQMNLDAFLRFTRDNYRKPLPCYVVRELKRYVGCGLLSRGFSRRSARAAARTCCWPSRARRIRFLRRLEPGISPDGGSARIREPTHHDRGPLDSCAS